MSRATKVLDVTVKTMQMKRWDREERLIRAGRTARSAIVVCTRNLRFRGSLGCGD